MKWLTRLLGGPRKVYKFQHERGPVHLVYARSLRQAEHRMRDFLSVKMFGEWGLFDDPAAVEREFRKCSLVNEEVKT